MIELKEVKIMYTTENNQRNEINQYIAGIPCEKIIYPGYNEDAKSEKSGFCDGNYTVTTKKVIEIDGEYDPATDAASNPIIYPGSLIAANQDIVEGTPHKFALTNGPARVTIDLPGMTTEDNNRYVQEANYASVNGAIQEMMAVWFDKYLPTNPLTGNFSFMSEFVKDQVEVQIKFGCSVSFTKNSLNLSGEFKKTNSKNVYLLRYKQVFFTASVPGYAEPADAFGENVTLEQIQFNIDATTPPAYIQTVVFGREVYLKFESELSEETIKGAIDAVFGKNDVNVDIDVEGEYKDVYEKISCSFVVKGGTAIPETKFSISKEDLSYIRELITNKAFTTASQAAPISYLVAAIYRNSPVGIYSKTKYIETTVDTYNSGIIRLEHNGWYVARFNITWKEIVGYKENGEPIYEVRTWEDNNENKTAPYSEEIALNGNCDKIYIEAFSMTGLPWEPWRNIFDRTDVPLIKERTFRISGTTLQPQYKIDPSC